MEPEDSQTLAEHKAALEARLVSSGKKAQLLDDLRQRLIDSGWREQMKAKCRELITDKDLSTITVRGLVNDLRDQARDTVPEEHKQAIIQQIKTFIEESQKQE